MRRAAKKDLNQDEIVTVLRNSGAAVLFTHQLKNAFDILVGYEGVLYMFEIKNPDYLPKKFFKMNFDEQRQYLIENKLEAGELDCLRTFEKVGVMYHIIWNPQQALDILGITNVYLDDWFN